MEEYRGNSNRSKVEAEESAKKTEESAKKFEKVITGTAKVKKKNGMTKLADALISEDAGNVKSYIFMDVLIPAMKKAISDIITNGIEMLLYGESGGSDRRRDRADRVSYGKYYNRDRDRRERSSRRATYEYDDVVVSTRGEAERVLDRMEEAIDEYGTVSVADLYELVDITGTFTDNKWGWTDLRGARSERVRDGYLIKLPRALPLD